tara:strand:- start:3 stop:212 length:210 start_codon:yes stop_codon:yes gene_type:complete
MGIKFIYNSEKNFYHNGKLFSLYNYCLVNGVLINHNLSEIPHTIEIQVDEYGEWVIIKANAERSYCLKL